MTTIAPINHIEVIEDPTQLYARIARRGFKVDVLVGVVIYANTPIEYVAEHHDLILAEIHAALAYYYDHKDIIDRQIEEGERLAQELGTLADEHLERIRQRAKAATP
jgi:uncharacterized protein (DUF433 family)